MQTLAGHVSQETAFLQEDYPYSFHLRCQRRVWLEYKERFGYRLATQTSNPKKAGLIWNAPKYGVYHPLAVLVIDAQEHIHIETVRSHGWSTVEEIDAFAAKHAKALEAHVEQRVLAWLRTVATAYARRDAARVH